MTYSPKMCILMVGDLDSEIEQPLNSIHLIFKSTHDRLISHLTFPVFHRCFSNGGQVPDIDFDQFSMIAEDQ